jgi:hypothetical protein
MFTRARLICAGLLATATAAVLVGAPAVVPGRHHLPGARVSRGTLGGTPPSDSAEGGSASTAPRDHRTAATRTPPGLQRPAPHRPLRTRTGAVLPVIHPAPAYGPGRQRNPRNQADLARQGSPTDASAPTTAGCVGLAHINRGSARNVVEPAVFGGTNSPQPGGAFATMNVSSAILET